MTEEILASSVGKNETRETLTFEVSEPLLKAMVTERHWLSLTVQGEDEWSPPVRFRFQKHDYDEGWDLVMKTEDAPA